MTGAGGLAARRPGGDRAGAAGAAVGGVGWASSRRSWPSSRCWRWRWRWRPAGWRRAGRASWPRPRRCRSSPPRTTIEAQARAALDVLRTTPGVRSVRMVDLAEQERLLEPWLGPEIPIESLPLPLMIEVATDRDALDAASLERAAGRPRRRARSSTTTPPGGEPLVATAERLRLFALGCLGLMALALAPARRSRRGRRWRRTGRRSATLRLVGARDGFIARALHPAAHAARRGRRGWSARRPAMALLGAAAARRASRGSSSSGSGSPAGSGCCRSLVPLAGRARRLGRGRGGDAARPAALELSDAAPVRSLVFDALLYPLMGVMGILGAPLALWSVDGAYAVCSAYCRRGLLAAAGDLRAPGRGPRRRCRRARCWSAPSTSPSSTS